MLKTLIKKQLSELISTMFGKSAMGKKGNKKGKMALYTLLLVYVFGVFAFMFYGTAEMFFDAFEPMGISWLAFALLGIAATGFGVLGTVFLTNSVLYNAKDNELLLSMPIKPAYIIFSRVFTLYVMDFFYESMIMLPCFAAYIVRGNISFGVIFGAVVLLFVLPLLSLALSLVLGFLVALVSGRMKNKSLVTMFVSVAFIVVYFYAVMKMENYMAMLIANGEAIGNGIKTFVYPLYALGLAGTGSILHLLIFTLCVAGLFALVCLIVCTSFIKLATMKKGGKKSVYREKTYKAGSAFGALFAKELAHFWASPTYMLNGAFGSLIMLVGAVALAVKGGDIRALLLQMPALAEILPLLICAAICMVSSMNLITAPAISLEGKNMWLLRSLPLSSWSVLESKIALQMLISGVPAFILALVCVIVFPMDIICAILLPVLTLVLNLLFAMLGLSINLKHPSFDWTNEAIPVKQGLSVLLTMLVGMAVTMFFAVAYVVLTFALLLAVPASVFLLAVLIVCAAATVLLYSWLYRRGTKIFETF
ncbi:MAG: hypothetical protein IJX55_00185 [Clostridia bacterium]|nr:hypothetical protein [Clostridia bacterium]